MENIRVKLIPGCPGKVVAETEADRWKAEAILQNIECGVVVEVEAAEAAEAVEAVEAEAGVAGEPGHLELEDTSEMEGVEPVCPIEPTRPWDESVCGMIQKRVQDDIVRRLEEEGRL